MFIGILALAAAAMFIVLLVYPPGPIRSSLDGLMTGWFVCFALILLAAGGGLLYEAGQKQAEHSRRATAVSVAPPK